MNPIKCLLRVLIAEEIRSRMEPYVKEQRKIMAAIDDLRQAVASLGTSISNELDAIVKKLSSPEGTSDADIEEIVAQLGALKSKVDAETDTLTGGQAPPSSSDEPPTPTS